MSNDDTVIPFTGKRKTPTEHDWKSLEDRVERILKSVRRREISGLVFLAVHDTETVSTDWLMLPGTSMSQVLAGATLLHAEALQAYIKRTTYVPSDGDSPNDSG